MQSIKPLDRSGKQVVSTQTRRLDLIACMKPSAIQSSGTAQHDAVRWAAFAWGAVAFFSISLNYIGLFGLLITLALDARTWPERKKRLRNSPNWWPASLFAGWFIIILVTGAHYAETASNAGHTLRIILTLAAVLMLDRKEVMMAVRGLAAGLILVLVLVTINHVAELPDFSLWHGVIDYTNNKSISTAILLAFAAGTILILLPRLTTGPTIISLILLTVILFILAEILQSRTAWVILMVSVLVGAISSIKTSPKWTLVLTAVTLFLLTVGALTPAVRDRASLGILQAVKAYQDPANVAGSSWGLRYVMYRETGLMIRQHPVMGNGIGSWNTLWRERVPNEIRGLNMPHNDFLWMGTQAGIPGMLLFLAMLAAGMPASWQRRHEDGGLGVMALLGLLIAISLNSALRDGAIGLPLWFVVLIWQRLSEEQALEQTAR